MTKLRRLLRNVPVPRIGVPRSGAPSILAVLIAASAFLAAPALFAPPALAAEELGLGDRPELPADVSPEQAEAVRQILQSDSEAKKLVESAKQQRDKAIQQRRKESESAETDAVKKALTPKEEGASTTGPVRYDWKKSTYVGGLFLQRLTPQETGILTHFGHELFVPSPGATQLIENIPVSPSYIVGPGDEIVVKMWGRVEGTQRMVVDRDGKIFLPKFGPLYVAGKTFDEVKSFLRSKVSTIAEVSSDVTLGQLKGIRISAVGEVQAPGWYNISSLHTALQALSIAGGMKDIGSLRRIRILRGGKEVQQIDLYDFLLSGDTRADIRLLQGDVIFVPVVGKLAAIVGDVRRPAIYELRDEKSLLDLVRVAGGLAPSAWKQRVQVERLEGNLSRIILDASVEELEKGRKAMDLADGDLVRVLQIARGEANAVTLEGNVTRPGRYELKPGMTVGTLLKDAKELLPDTYFDYALLTRLVPPDQHKEIIPVNLREIVLERKPGADVALRAQDRMTVYNRSAFRDPSRVTISGEIRMTRQELARAPKTELQATLGKAAREAGTALSIRSENNVPAFGKTSLEVKGALEARADDNVLAFEILQGMRVSDLVKLAGGLTRLAYLDRAEVVRVEDNRMYRTIYFHLGKAVALDPAEDLLLSHEDHVRIHSVMETRYKRTVTAAGDVNNAGEYVLTEGMRLSDLLFKAGGFRESAYTSEAELIRRQVTDNGSLVRVEARVVHPERALGGDASADVPLKEFDLLVIRPVPDWSQKIQVTLAGEVQFPGDYDVHKGERLSSVIARAGGFTKDAYLKAAQFTRASTRKTQQEAIDKLIEDLEVEVAQKGQQVSGALDKEDVEANKELVASRRALIQQLKKARAKGRVIMRIADDGRIQGALADVLLEDGDRLEVPGRMNVVNVVGRVYNPTGVVFDPARDAVGYYLRLVGGPTESADRDHIFLLRADGSVVTKDTADVGFFAFGGRGLMNARVEPGDSILVPEKLVQVRFMKDVKDITQILYQIAVTAGVLIVAF